MNQLKFTLKIALTWFFLLNVLTSSAQSVEVIITDSISKEPIDNVYVYNKSNVFLCVSNTKGVCSFVLNDNFETKSNNIIISHIGYISKEISSSELKNNHTYQILLTPKTFELKEVLITIIKPNAQEIVAKAINQINYNYRSLYKDTTDLKVRLNFFENTTTEIADFEGNISITGTDKGFHASKYNIRKSQIKKSFYEYQTEISPNSFYTIVLVGSHLIVRKQKKFKLKYNGISEYNGLQVYKISFRLDKKCAGQSGYLLINTKDYAILHINYTINKCSKWIGAIKKPYGLIYTNLKYYKISSSYHKIKGKYEFSKGLINTQFSREKKKRIISNNTYNVTVESIKRKENKNLKYSNIDELFMYEK
jgi:hypothetical protein